jgi:hypothetical protein
MRKIRMLQDVDPRVAQRAIGEKEVVSVLDSALQSRVQDYVVGRAKEDSVLFENVPKRVSDCLRESLVDHRDDDMSVTAVTGAPRAVTRFQPTFNQDEKFRVPPFKVETIMHNGMPVPVTVQDRSGLKVRFKPNNPKTQIGIDVNVGEFVVRVRHVIDDIHTQFDVQSMALDANGVYDPHVERTDSEAVARVWWQQNKDELQRRVFRTYESTYGVSCLCLDYRFKMDELMKDRSIYCQELDLIISIEDVFEDVPPHPSTLYGNKKMFMQGDPLIAAGTGLQYRLIIVDNSRRVKERYANINGEVYRIKPVMSKILRNGCWLIQSSPAAGNGKGKMPMQVRFADIHRMDKVFNLYSSYEEAMSLGGQIKVVERAENQLKMELAHMKREQAQQDREFATFRANVDREKLALEHERYRERMAWERERDIREHQLAILKEKAETAGHRRKSSLEWLKFIPATLGAIGSLGILLL